MAPHLLLKTLQERHDFPQEAFQKFLPLFEQRFIPKNEMLFRQDSVVKHLCFVLQGCMRQYHVTSEGIERNLFFAEEGWWCGEMDSFINRIPSTMSMQALEDCHVLSIDRENWEYATRNIPDYALYQIKNRGRTVAWLKNLLTNMATETPDEKYRRMLKECPHWMNRLPQYHLASYLGITPETLSRIRKRNMHL
jgi:CRP-like cAMP-binding protein